MKPLFPALLLMSLLACTPKPPILVITRTASDLGSVKTAAFQLGAVQKVELHDFKRAFVKKYGDEAAFLKGFHADLSAQLAADAAPGAPRFLVELQRLDVDSHTVTSSYMVGGGPNMPGHMQTTSTEYCVIKLDYQVKTEAGAILLEGQVQERTAKGEFLHPNQSKLANAVSGVQQHLVNYLRGRLPAENIKAADAPTKG